ncbi:MAG: HAMP domain-containing protein, partial [Bryobacteraceae bacterium]|nr:HAMP domain-containing protein [Bryobacteraceae bacterium]
MVIATAIDFDGSDQQRAPLGTIFSLQLAEARNAYETGGPDALRKTLERFRRLTDSEGVLTDAEGRDLVSGQIRTDLRDAARRRRRGTFAGKRGGTVIGRPSRDGQYFYFLTLQGRGVVRWFLQPEVHLAVLLVLTVLSYAFARYLTSPVRKLQIAVECFGRGDFGSRVRSTRQDELGQLARTFDQMADRIETLLDAERR